MGGKGGGGGGSSTDVRGAARETGKQARELAREQTFANRPNQYNPWGSTEWTWNTDPSTGIDRWTQTETLNPDLQRTLDAQLGTQAGRAELAQSQLGQLQGNMSTPMDFGQYGDVIGFDPTEQRQTAEDAAYGRATSRLDPQFEEQAQKMEINLRNKGLRAGDAAYDAQMATFNRSKNDAYEQARLGSVEQGRAEFGIGLQGNQYANELRRSQIEEDLYKRGFPLEEINRLMQGQEIEGSTPSSSDQATIADNLRGD